MREDGTAVILLARLGLAGMGLGAGIPLLLWFSWLRERPIFWRNEGGYPIWLRDLVLDGYYPLLAGNVLVVLVYGVLLLHSPPQGRGSLMGQFAAFVLMTSLIVGAFFYILYVDL